MHKWPISFFNLAAEMHPGFGSFDAKGGDGGSYRLSKVYGKSGN